jgi:hypothetical protein
MLAELYLFCTLCSSIGKLQKRQLLLEVNRFYKKKSKIEVFRVIAKVLGVIFVYVLPLDL